MSATLLGGPMSRWRPGNCSMYIHILHLTPLNILNASCLCILLYPLPPSSCIYFSNASDTERLLTNSKMTFATVSADHNWEERMWEESSSNPLLRQKSFVSITFHMQMWLRGLSHCIFARQTLVFHYSSLWSPMTVCFCFCSLRG